MMNITKSESSTSFAYKMIQVFLVTFTALVLSACGSSSETSQSDEALSVALPDALLSSRVDRNNLSATVSYGSTTQAMSIDDLNDSASATLTNVPTGATTITITFFYDFGGTTLTVAQASQNVTISEGSNTISFAATDFDTASFDEDGDGISNIAELDETSNTDPTVERCLLDTSSLDNCELG